MGVKHFAATTKKFPKMYLLLARTPKHNAGALGRALAGGDALDARVAGGKNATARALHEFVREGCFKITDARLELSVLVL
jgi:hypothetical protein